MKKEGEFKEEVISFNFETDLVGEFSGSYSDSFGNEHKFWGNAEFNGSSDYPLAEVTYCIGDRSRFTKEFCWFIQEYINETHDFSFDVQEHESMKADALYDQYKHGDF